MAVLLTFLMGIVNFALHRATLESDHPMVAQMREPLGRIARGRGTYILEFVILFSALGFASMGSAVAMPVYGGYTVLNGLAAWLLLTRRF